MSEEVPRLKRKQFLSPEDSKELEQHLLEHPDDFETRVQLLGHYGWDYWLNKMIGHTLQQRSTETTEEAISDIGWLHDHFESARQSHSRHILWIVQHPNAKLASTAIVLMNREMDEEALLSARTRLAQEVAEHPESLPILGQAARFFFLATPQDRRQAQKWLRKAESQAPDSPEWPEQLGLFYDIERRQLAGQKRKAAAQRALRCFKRAYRPTDVPEKRAALLDGLARNAFEAEVFTQAAEYAARLLQDAPLYEESGDRWNYGDALHWGHIVQGRLSLRQEDKRAAKAHLWEAGKTPGSPQLNAFGPDTALAKDLLELGEREVVTDYLKACSRFWKIGKLSGWFSAIRQYRTPDFN